MDVIMNEQQCKKINAYFRGASTLLPKIVFFVALVIIAIIGFASDNTTLILILAPIDLIGCIIWANVIKSKAKHEGKEEVDRAIAEIREQVKAAGYEYLNLDPSEVSGVNPLVIVSPGSETSVIDETNGAVVRVGFFKRLSNNFNALSKQVGGSKNNALAHRQIERFGDDYKYRYALNEFTVYYFGQNQVYAYAVSVDLTAGYTYACNMHEIFYSDICGIELLGQKREMLTTQKTGCKNNEYIHKPVMFRTFALYGSGCKIVKTMLEYEGDISFNVELQGMRSYIRERKNAN